MGSSCVAAALKMTSSRFIYCNLTDELLHSHGGGGGGGGGGVALVSAAHDVAQLYRPLYICGGHNGGNVLLIADHKNTISYR